MSEMLSKKKIGELLGKEIWQTRLERRLALYAYEMWARLNGMNELCTKYSHQGERLSRIIRDTKEQKDLNGCLNALESQQKQFEQLELKRREILNIT